MHRWVFWVALIWLFVFTGYKVTVWTFPASYWLDVRRVAVFDSLSDTQIIMEVDREIHRSFVADWSVVVRRWNSGNWTVACTARGTSDYRPDAALPDPLTLEWWTDGECPTLSAGRYLISTIWTIRGHGGLPDKIVQTASNVFTVGDEEHSGPEGRFQD